MQEPLPLPHIPIMAEEVPVTTRHAGLFEMWQVKVYDTVEEGDCVAKFTDGSSLFLVGAPVAGTIVAFQALLQPGAVVGRNQTIAVVSTRPEVLREGPSEATLAPFILGQVPLSLLLKRSETAAFQSMLLGVGEVRKGTGVAVFRDARGRDLTLTSGADGYIVDIKEMKVGDALPGGSVVATLAPKLTIGDHQFGLVAKFGGVFRGWFVPVNSRTRVGSAVADFGEVTERSERAGVIQHVLALKRGDRVTPGTVLAVLEEPGAEQTFEQTRGPRHEWPQSTSHDPATWTSYQQAGDATETTTRALAPTPAPTPAPTRAPVDGQVPVVVPALGGTFDKLLVDVGSFVLKGAPLVQVAATSRQGRALKGESSFRGIRAPITGVLVSCGVELGEEVVPGMTVGYMAPRLEADRHQFLYRSSAKVTFDAWRVSVDDYVTKHQELASVVSASGKRFSITSDRAGWVARVLPLQQGDVVSEHIALVILDRARTSLLEKLGKGLTGIVFFALLAGCCCLLCQCFCRPRNAGNQKTTYSLLSDRHASSSAVTSPLQSRGESAVMSRSRVSEPAVMSRTSELALPDGPMEGVRIDFEVSEGQVTSKFFNFRPLGIRLKKDPERHTLKITGFCFNSYAEFEGVTIGWSILRVNGGDLPRVLTAASAEQLLEDSLSRHPCWPLRIDFRTRAGSIEKRYFENTPLGLVFPHKAPIRIESFRFNSYAADLGVEAGWVITRIADTDVTDMEFNEVDKMLVEGLSRLDPVPSPSSRDDEEFEN